MFDYELYEGKTAQGRKKSYFVAKDYDTALKAARKVLKVPTYRILVEVAWTIGEDLFFKNPHKKGQKKVYAASFLA